MKRIAEDLSKAAFAKKTAFVILFRTGLLIDFNVTGVARMSDVLPEGEDLRRAVRWVSGGLQENAGQTVQQLVQEAIFKFDLSPKDAEFLIGFFRQRKE
jgi:hypothetical protein